MKPIAKALSIFKEKMANYLGPKDNKNTQFDLFFTMLKLNFDTTNSLKLDDNDSTDGKSENIDENNDTQKTQKLISFLIHYYNYYTDRKALRYATSPFFPLGEAKTFETTLIETIGEIQEFPVKRERDLKFNENHETELPSIVITGKTSSKPSAEEAPSWRTTTTTGMPTVPKEKKTSALADLKKKLADADLTLLRREFANFILTYNSELRYSDSKKFDDTHSYIVAVSYFVERVAAIIKSPIPITQEENRAFLKILHTEVKALSLYVISFKDKETIDKMAFTIEKTLFTAMVSVKLDKQAKFDELQKLDTRICAVQSISELAKIYSETCDNTILNTPRNTSFFAKSTASDSHALLLILKKLQTLVHESTSIDETEKKALLTLHHNITQRLESFTLEILQTSFNKAIASLRKEMKSKLSEEDWKKVYIPYGVASLARTILRDTISYSTKHF